MVIRHLVPTLIALLLGVAPLPAEARERSVLVGFHKAPGAAERALIHAAGGEVRREFRLIRGAAIRLPEAAVESLKASPTIAYVEDDAVLALVEPSVGTSVETGSAWGVTRVGAPAQHSLGNFGQGVRVAVLDTGIDLAHPELIASFRGGVNLVGPALSEPQDDSWNGHGTHVAGILAAADDGAGVVGVAPAVELYAVKVADGSGFGTVGDLIAGLEWAVDNRMAIVNISLGTKTPSLALAEGCRAAAAAGVLLVAAAGNSGGEDRAVLYPAAYEEVIAVAATGRDDAPLWMSAAGEAIELAAPGGAILSTAPGGGYATLTGTSQAAPHVAGVAALLLAAGLHDLDGSGTADHRDLRLQLQNGAQDLGTAGRDEIFGHGLVQAAAAAPVTMRLTRLRGAVEQSRRELGLAAGCHEIRISNDSLSRVKIEAFDRNGPRPDLFRSLPFRPKDPAEATLGLDTGAEKVTLVLVPEGPVGGFAELSVHSCPAGTESLR